MFIKRIQLGLIHVAVAMTLVPINSTLNRVMIKELAISATLVAILASLPYLFSPIQVAIGSFSDRHPLFGYQRPYIFMGLLLCIWDSCSRHSRLPDVRLPGWSWLALLAFGGGMGCNFSSLSYLRLPQNCQATRAAANDCRNVVHDDHQHHPHTRSHWAGCSTPIPLPPYSRLF
jgi:BCD family chlorophyll transporter-like MFS transporter